MAFLQRKYVDLIRNVSSQWANWDSPTLVKVGDYGEVDTETGNLKVLGSIYKSGFQAELDSLGQKLYTADYPPHEEKEKDDIIISFKGTRQVDISLAPEAGIASIANASLKGQWKFEKGKRDALLVMHRPSLHSLPEDVVLKALYKAPKLKDKWLVTSVYTCPAFSMYLSNKSGETVTLALVAQVPGAGTAGVTAGASGGIGWHSDASAELFCKAYDETGKPSYTPLYALKRHVGWFKRLFRAEEDEDQLEGDELWADAQPPWEPLDEDGTTDSLDMIEEDPLDF